MKRVAIALILVAVLGSRTAAAEKIYNLTVALPWPAKPPVCCMAVPVAKDLGYYTKQGLNVTFVNIGTASTGTMQTLVAGRADVGTASVASGFGAYAAGATDIRYIGAELNSIYSLNKLQWYYAAKTSINTVADLKGKTIGLVVGPNPTDPVYVQINALITSAGLNDRDVRYTIAGTQAARAQALISGRIDFTPIPMEMSYLVTPANGLHMISFEPVGDNKGWGGCQCWFTTANALKDPEKHEAIQRFVNATTLALRDLVNDRAVFAKAMALYIDMTPQTAASIEATWQYERVQWLANGGVNLDYMNKWLKDVYFPTINPAARGKIELAQIVDASLVKAFLDQYGTDGGAVWDPPQLSISRP